MRLLPVLAVSTALLATPVGGQSLKSDEFISSVAVSPISVPNPVTGADGRVHLAYELMVVNSSRLFVTLDKVEAVDATGRRLWGLEGDALAVMIEQFGTQGRQLPPGGSAAVLMDVSFGEGEALPREVSARITATRLARHAWRLFHGSLAQVPGVVTGRAARVQLSQERPLTIHLDGEVMPAELSRIFEVRPRSLRVMVPVYT